MVTAKTSRRIGLTRSMSKLGYCSRSQAAELIRAGRRSMGISYSVWAWRIGACCSLPDWSAWCVPHCPERWRFETVPIYSGPRRSLTSRDASGLRSNMGPGLSGPMVRWTGLPSFSVANPASSTVLRVRLTVSGFDGQSRSSFGIQRKSSLGPDTASAPRSRPQTSSLHLACRIGQRLGPRSGRSARNRTGTRPVPEENFASRSSLGHPAIIPCQASKAKCPAMLS